MFKPRETCNLFQVVLHFMWSLATITLKKTQMVRQGVRKKSMNVTKHNVKNTLKHYLVCEHFRLPFHLHWRLLNSEDTTSHHQSMYLVFIALIVKHLSFVLSLLESTG